MTKIYIAIVSTEHGIDVLGASTNHETVERALAGYCRDWWHEENVDIGSDVDPDTTSDSDVISTYFNSEDVIAKGEVGAIETTELA